MQNKTRLDMVKNKPIIVNKIRLVFHFMNQSKKCACNVEKENMRKDPVSNLLDL